MLRIFLLIGIFFLSIVNHIADAKTLSQPLSLDPRIKVVTYEKDTVVPIYGLPLITTQIIFAKDEQILEIENGDHAAWDIPKPYLRASNMLFLKPNILGSHTNLTVITNKRSYYFYLQSPAKLTQVREATYAIHFVYPQDAVIPQARARKCFHPASDPNKNFNKYSHYNWSYTFSGDARLKPTQVFDDGRFTYFKFSSEQTLPAIFAVDNCKGEEAVVNFRRQGDNLTVERIAPQFTLRNGKTQVASIFNKTLIDKLKENH